MFSHLPTRFVVPLIPVDDAPIVHGRLHPRVVVAGVDYVLAAQLALTVDKRNLRRRIGSVDDDYAIIGALGLLLTGA